MQSVQPLRRGVHRCAPVSTGVRRGGTESSLAVAVAIASGPLSQRVVVVQQRPVVLLVVLVVLLVGVRVVRVVQPHEAWGLHAANAAPVRTNAELGSRVGAGRGHDAGLEGRHGGLEVAEQVGVVVVGQRILQQARSALSSSRLSRAPQRRGALAPSQQGVLCLTYLRQEGLRRVRQVVGQRVRVAGQLRRLVVGRLVHGLG